MYKTKISVFTICVLILILFLHKYAIEYHFYIKYWFYDIIMHFLGGVGLAMSIYCISVFFNLSFINNSLSRIILLSVLLGIFWEIFEVVYDVLGFPFGTAHYYFDTTKDLIMDTLGATAVWLFIKNKKV